VLRTAFRNRVKLDCHLVFFIHLSTHALKIVILCRDDLRIGWSEIFYLNAIWKYRDWIATFLCLLFSRMFRLFIGKLRKRWICVEFLFSCFEIIKMKIAWEVSRNSIEQVYNDSYGYLIGLSLNTYKPYKRTIHA
jgi:hypothetical protein